MQSIRFNSTSTPLMVRGSYILNGGEVVAQNFHGEEAYDLFSYLQNIIHKAHHEKSWEYHESHPHTPSNFLIKNSLEEVAIHHKY